MASMVRMVKNIQFIFFMALVLQFDESIGENVTVNLKIV